MIYVQIIVTIALVCYVSGCDDFAYWRFDKDDKKSCAEWVKKWPVIRCEKTDSFGKRVKDKCRATCNTCPGASQPVKKGVGESCSMNSQCHSLLCYSGVCTQHSQPSTSKKTIGQYCTSNSQCQSAHCSGNICSLNTNPVPTPSSPSTNTRKGIGQSCRWNYQCQSRNCLNNVCSSAGNSNLSPSLPSPSPPSPSTRTKKAIGQSCRWNYQCQSKNCVNKVCSYADNSNPSPSPPSSTNTKKGVGQSCRWNYQCQSRNCLNSICSSEGDSNPLPSWPSPSPPSPSTDMKKAIGQLCQWNSQCLSNRCHDRICSISSIPSPSHSWPSYPTPSWPSLPSPPPPGLKSAGQLCTSNFQCQSGYCTRGVCFESRQCQIVDSASFPLGSEFHENKIILVFVASGFVGKQNDFRNEIQNAYSEVKKVEMFKDSDARYQAFYVNQMHDSFCDYGCEDVDRLLCCDLQITRSLANKCFPASSKVQTIVIHNDFKYGGAGYASDNVAIISKNTVGARLAVHELGHSLFEFGDEYKYGDATASTKANCDVKGCPKWKDLQEHPTLGGGLCEIKSCQNGQFFSGRNSFMRNMYMPVGMVNLRFTCCTYLAYTKQTPSYCNKFEFGQGLLQYCMNDYQGYGGSDIYKRRNLRSTNIKSSNAKHHEVDDSHVSLSLDLDSKNFTISEHRISSPILFRKHHLLGEYNDLSEVELGGFQGAHRVRVMFESGQEQVYIFSDTMPVHVPPFDPYGNATVSEDDDRSHIIFTMRKNLEIVVDGSKGRIKNITSEHVKLR